MSDPLHAIKLTLLALAGGGARFESADGRVWSGDRFLDVDFVAERGDPLSSAIAIERRD